MQCKISLDDIEVLIINVLKLSTLIGSRAYADYAGNNLADTEEFAGISQIFADMLECEPIDGAIDLDRRRLGIK